MTGRRDDGVGGGGGRPRRDPRPWWRRPWIWIHLGVIVGVVLAAWALSLTVADDVSFREVLTPREEP